MDVSGAHCDMLGEHMKKTHATVRKNHVMSFAPLHYICQHCDDHPDLDATFAVFMNDTLKSDSNNMEDDETKEKKGTRGTRKKELDAMKETLKESACTVLPLAKGLCHIGYCYYPI